MQKILVAINIVQPDLKVLEFAGYLAKLTHSKLTGVFVDDLPFKEGSVMESMYETPYIREILGNGGTKSKIRAEMYEENVRFFEEACKGRGVNYYMRYDKGMPTDSVIHETRFADVLIVDPGMSFEEKPEGTPTDFIRKVLEKSECPVIIAPSEFNGIDEVVFAYDGSASSVFAIKQFTSLFPEFIDTRMIVLQVNEKENATIVERERLLNLLQVHYSGTGFEVLHGKADTELFGYLLGKKNILVVMGAYGRGALSDFFRRSTADLIVKTINLPVFIAHP